MYKTACIKQNTAVKTAIDACSLLAKQTFSVLVGDPASLLIINFEQVREPFLVLNIYFTFSLLVVDCTFYKNNYILLLCHVRVRSSRQELLCKKGVLRNFSKFTGNCARVPFVKKRLWNRCFRVNFAKLLRTSFLTEHLRWLLLAFQSESTLCSFRTSCSKQAQYLKFK